MPDLNSRQDFLDYVKQFNFVTMMFTGYMYTFNYQFIWNKKFPDIDIGIKRFYDYYPVTFIFKENRKAKSYYGLNFHHLPVASRRIWLSRVATRFKADNNRIFAKYEQIKPLFYKSTYAVRQYQWKRIRHLRMIPYKKWGEILEFTPRTYFAASLKEVEMQYRKFIPKI